MLFFKKVADLRQFIDEQRSNDASIGFVPTMGALHEGHLSLIRQSQADTDCTICNIFVNPTQFNDASDLELYPRPVEDDIQLLTEVGCDVLFMPDVNEVYPPGLDTSLEMDYKGLDQVMEGAFRAGHFAGVVQVVNRLLEMVEPDLLFMGQKDYQQFRIIERMLEATSSKVKLVMCPIVREADGLAMSSRNRRLPADLRKAATIIHQTLTALKAKISHSTPSELKAFALDKMTIPGFKPEYVEIAHGKSLQPLEEIKEGEPVVACAAVWAGDVRLIDNIICQ